MIDHELLRVWLSQVPTPLEFRWFKGPRTPEYGYGDQVAVLTPSPGPGPTLEGVGNFSAFQVRLEAREHAVDELRASAFEIDRELMFGGPSGPAWGTRVQWVDRTGGEPSPLVSEGESGDRVIYVCTYLAHETV